MSSSKEHNCSLNPNFTEGKCQEKCAIRSFTSLDHPYCKNKGPSKLNSSLYSTVHPEERNEISKSTSVNEYSAHICLKTPQNGEHTCTYGNRTSVSFDHSYCLNSNQARETEGNRICVTSDHTYCMTESPSPDESLNENFNQGQNQEVAQARSSVSLDHSFDHSYCLNSNQARETEGNRICVTSDHTYCMTESPSPDESLNQNFNQGQNQEVAQARSSVSLDHNYCNFNSQVDSKEKYELDLSTSASNKSPYNVKNKDNIHGSISFLGLEKSTSCKANKHLQKTVSNRTTSSDNKKKSCQNKVNITRDFKVPSNVKVSHNHGGNTVQNSSNSMAQYDSTITNDNVPSLKLFDFSNYSADYNDENIDGIRYKNLAVPGDGNCFFHSVSLAIHGNFSESNHYRHLVCMHITDNWDIWGDLAALSHDLPSNSVSDYCNVMIKRNGWATVCELKVTCNLLNVNIHTLLKGVCFDKDSRKFKNRYTCEIYSSSQNTDITITLLLSNQHFTLLTKQSTNGRLEKNDIQSLDINQEITNGNKRKIKSNPENPVAVTDKPAKRPKLSVGNSVIQSNQNNDNEMLGKCRKLGIPYEAPTDTETKHEATLRRKRNAHHVKKAQEKYSVQADNLPDPPPLSNDTNYNKIMDCIRAFELEQMSYDFGQCSICHECRLQMQMASENICQRCSTDKNYIKMFSSTNFMDPMPVPPELQNLTLVEQQLICRIAPVIHIHMLKHGGIAANGHCVTFPQNVNEPAQILPLLPKDIKMIRVRKMGTNDTSKEFNVRRSVVQNALNWLKTNNKAYSDVTISQERLEKLPENAPIKVDTVETRSSGNEGGSDDGPAPDQADPGTVDTETVSCISLPDEGISIRDQVEKVVKDVVGENHGNVTDRRQKICIPWPTRNNTPLSEFTTKHFFTLAFPCLFPYGFGDYHINRPRTCTSMTEWAEHLMWYKDGRFAQHQYFKFIVHNIIMRKRTLEQSNYIVKQQLGEDHLSLSDLKEKIQNGDDSIAKKVIYFGACLRGTSQYWAQRNRELRSLIQYQINEGNGLPSFFTTGSCAEYHFQALRRLLNLYIQKTSGLSIDLSNRNTLFSALQKNTHVVSHYFDLRTQSYFNKVMQPGFGVSTFWYRQEFAKSRGMIHWHGLCWRGDRQPHNLLFEAIQKGLSDDQAAQHLSDWAESNFGLTGNHPAGNDENGQPNKNLWPPPEGTAPAPPEEKNPLLKLLMEVSESQETLLEDHLLLCNRINLHRCSNYCLKPQKGNLVCRMEFGTDKNPGKTLRKSPAIVFDKNKSMRLEMARDHPMLVQHSMFHTQGWRANGDISLILSKSSPENPSVDEIIATEKYITGYACKGNQPTGAVVDLFNDMVHAADGSCGASTKSVCTKLLMNTVKRDISSMETTYELLALPLYRCSHQFQMISFSGSRVLERTGKTLTKTTPLDKYLARHEDDTSSWYQYICKQGKVPVISGSSIRATWPLQEDFCRSMILLHTPNWRKLDDIKKENKSWEDLMSDFLKTQNCPNFVKADIERAKRHEPAEHFEEADSGSDEDSDIEKPDWVQLLQPLCEYPNPSADYFDDGGPDYDWGSCSMEYPDGYGLKFLESLGQDESKQYECFSFEDIPIQSMNKEQKFAFNLVMTTLMKYKENPSTVESIRLIVTGTAGSGKSFLIKCLVHAVQKLFHSTKAIQVLCPTGNSANLIAGKTIHSFFGIPTGAAATKEMSPPDGLKGETVQENCKDLAALIVDERSLVGSKTLGWMEFICRYGMNKQSLSWGGLPIVVFLGDDVQLPPVCDTPVYAGKSKTSAGMHGSLVWKEFCHAVELKTVIRQNSDQQQLKDVLMSLREYKATKEQTAWLQQFQWDNLTSKYGPSFMTDLTDNGLFVFPSHAAESHHNHAQLLKANLNAPVAQIAAVNKGPHAKTAPSDKAGGLLNMLYLCRGSKVMLTSNLAVKFGLFNGSTGVVTDIIYFEGRHPKYSLPDVVMVRFPKFNGTSFLTQEPNVVPIVPVERMIECPCHGCKRQQVPLRLGWGTTIHRCQGMTIGAGETSRYIVIDPGTKSFESKNPGALFVALSRAKSAGGTEEYPDFAWHPSVLVNEDRICHCVDTPTTKARKQEIQRISELAKQTKIDFAYLNTETSFKRIITELNNENKSQILSTTEE